VGLLKPSFRSILNHRKRIVATWIGSIVMFILFSVISLLTQGMLTMQMFLRFSALLITTNLIAVIAIALVSFYVAILTFRRGLDPDNFVIPIESSLADSITTVALLISLFLVSYGFYG
jgi:mgtE-like transporter